MTRPTESPIPSYARDPLVSGIYKTSGVLTVIAVAVAAPFGVSLSLSIAIGSGIAMLGFWLLEQTLSWSYRSATKRKRAATVALSLLKYVAVGAGLYVAVRSDRIHVGAFAGGLTVVFFAFVALTVVRGVRRTGDAA